jgi:Bacterial Ig-like domain (group 3)/Right handed beta helix region
MRGSISALKLRRRSKVCVERLEDRQLLATITVNTAADPATPGTTLSLRQAIEVSDGTLAVPSLSTQEQAQVSGAIGNTNTIDFNIPTSDPGYNSTTGAWTIAVNSELPAITTNAAIIDGYSQPGASPNTLARGDNAVLKIAINGAGAGNTYGLRIAQQGSQLRGLDIEDFGFNGYGILVSAAGNVQVAGCFIGTDPTGKIAAPNANGLEIENSSNLIGGPNVGDRNIISGNSSDGLFIPDQVENPLNVEPTGNVIENNYIGTDATGSKAVGNVQGVDDAGSGDTYGGTTTGLGNVISGNLGSGLVAGGSVTIEGNDIGTDSTGNVALGNAGYGIDAAQDLGGAPLLSVIIMNNVVSGNDEGGIFASQIFQASPATYTIANNLVGTNAAGTAAMGNGFDGIFLGYVSSSSILDNVISANAIGLRLSGCLSDVVQGNLIGTDETGKVALGNTTGGIVLSNFSGTTSGNMIGGTGPGQGNVIADNAGIGIEVTEGQQNQITHNSIFGNAGPGIYLDPAVGLPVPAPKLTFTPAAGSTGTLSGTLKASPSVAYSIEVFSNPSAEPAGEEQGKAFVQAVMVDTDSSGNGTFSVTEPIGFYTATAIDPSGNTSPFSNAVGSQALAASQTVVVSSLDPSTVGQPVTFTAVVTAPSFHGTPTGTVTFTIDGQTESPVPLAMDSGSDEAVFTATALSAGSHTVSASYSGDNNVSASSASLLTQTVTAPRLQTTTTTLASSLDPSTAGQAVTFAAVVAPGGTTSNPSGSVTFTIDGVSQAPVPLQVVRGSDQATLSIASLGEGAHIISAAYSGDSSFAASAAASPLVQTVHPLVQTVHPPVQTVHTVIPPGVDGPTVVAVKRFGIHTQPTALELSFKDGLDPASAQNLSNFKIVGPDGHAVRIGSAVFDAATNTVMLHPTRRINLHHTYRLTVIGTGPHGVTNTEGIPLDGGNAGQPGSNYTGTLTWRNVVWAPGDLDKNGHPKPYRPGGALNHTFLSKRH